MILINEVFKKIKKKIGEVSYQRYITNLIFQEKLSAKNSFVFEANNIFIAKWVKSRYFDIIKNAIEAEINSKVELHFVVKGENEALKDIDKKNRKNKSSFLNPALTFSSFVVGESNQFAYTAGFNTAKEPGVLFNPLFVYGESGLGKTHLLQAIGNYNLNNDKVVIYTTIEQFMNDFTFNLKRNTMNEFKAKYRECDILLIDDVQFISKKDKLQEEFFHTFNEIHNKKGQIVLTADMHPKKIQGLEDRLRSRFEWGMIIDIQPSDIETRVEIINKKCEIDGIELDKPIVRYIATNLNNNIREIEGVLIQLNAKARWTNQKIDLNLVKKTIEEYKQEKKEDITIDKILDITAKEFGIRVSDIKSKSRSRNIAKARRMVILIAREITDIPTPALAQLFNLKDHSSISHTIRRVKEEIKKDENFELLVSEIKTKLTSK